jgi:hypothetical protein
MYRVGPMKEVHGVPALHNISTGRAILPFAFSFPESDRVGLFSFRMIFLLQIHVVGHGLQRRRGERRWKDRLVEWLTVAECTSGCCKGAILRLHVGPKVRNI